ncbi:radical SAM/SPASM domain-containing protein [Allohahella marinimesophila]|uniref:4Fe4S-binding SPASM domain-containing protein n=1 Tax=Allohahella marinimesophila TaxID=1054972 RepID=A0ABP7NN57_9GAMM
MESIYYVLCWHCHRRCKHCYESRFHPYVREELEAVVSEAERNAPAIVANLPETMMYEDWRNPAADGRPVRRRGRIILSGGDVLTEPVRERVLYPTIEALRKKYENSGGVNIVVQTTGDLVTPKIIDELLSIGVWMISIAGLDDYHVGMKGEGKTELENALRRDFEAAGMHRSGLRSTERLWMDEEGPVYSAFGATEDAWIGKLWPRGRAWQNSLSTATMTDNFCNAWSGGLNFLEHGRSGSEVSIDPSGDFYPCCIKTAHPLGNLVEEKLIDVLESLVGHPAMEAINAGKPERMAVNEGWPVERFFDASHTTKPDGGDYANLCIGCDSCFTDVIGPALSRLREQRLARARGLLAVSG